MAALQVSSDLDRLAAGAARAAALVPREMGKAMTAIVSDAERESKLTAPVRFGFYKATIAGSVSIAGSSVVGQVSAGGGVVDYAGYINRGTRYMRARPHINRAVRNAVANSPRHIRAAINRITASMGGR